MSTSVTMPASGLVSGAEDGQIDNKQYHENYHDDHNKGTSLSCWNRRSFSMCCSSDTVPLRSTVSCSRQYFFILMPNLSDISLLPRISSYKIASLISSPETGAQRRMSAWRASFSVITIHSPVFRSCERLSAPGIGRAAERFAIPSGYSLHRQ